MYYADDQLLTYTDSNAQYSVTAMSRLVVTSAVRGPSSMLSIVMWSAVNTVSAAVVIQTAY